MSRDLDLKPGDPPEVAIIYGLYGVMERTEALVDELAGIREALTRGEAPGAARFEHYLDGSGVFVPLGAPYAIQGSVEPGCSSIREVGATHGPAFTCCVKGTPDEVAKRLGIEVSE